jgi:hypothetical protein
MPEPNETAVNEALEKQQVIDYLERVKEPFERNYRDTMDYYSGRDADWRIMRVLTDAIEIVNNA